MAKARKSWGRMQGILRREGATPRISGNFFKSVVQLVLLFGAETWVVTPKMEWALSAFLHGAARRLTGRQPWRVKDGDWHYPSLEGAMKEAGLTDIRTSILRRQNTVAQYGRHKSTMMCKRGAERKRRRLAEAEIRESTEMASKVYGQ